jgi:hypothetical protein
MEETRVQTDALDAVASNDALDDVACDICRALPLRLKPRLGRLPGPPRHSPRKLNIGMFQAGIKRGYLEWFQADSHNLCVKQTSKEEL